MLRDRFYPRKADREELKALNRRPCDVVSFRELDGRRPNLWAFTGSGEKTACVIGGFIRHTKSVHIPWMLCTRKAHRHGLEITRKAKSLIYRHFQDNPDCSLLCGVVSAANTQAVRWIKLVGFTVKEPIPVTPSWEKFHTFYMTRKENLHHL